MVTLYKPYAWKKVKPLDREKSTHAYFRQWKQPDWDPTDITLVVLPDPILHTSHDLPSVVGIAMDLASEMALIPSYRACLPTSRARRPPSNDFDN